MLARIYCLYNTLDGNIFYVGSTVGKVKSRLSDHKTINGNWPRSVYTRKRSLYIKSVLSSGGSIGYFTIFVVSDINRDAAERSAYNVLTSAGFSLIQHPNQFNSLKKGIWKKQKISPLG